MSVQKLETVTTVNKEQIGHSIRPGYRKSEVGLIPEDWETKRLVQIARVTAGGTPSRKVPEYWNGWIPWITTTEIDYCTISTTAEAISPAGLANSAAKMFPRGTLLMALYGQGKTRGKVAILGIDATSNQACAGIELSDSVSNKFVYYYLACQYEQIRGLSNSGSQDNLSGQLVKSIVIPLPPTLAEQEAIAEALGDADALIESLERLLAKKRNIKQAAMQQLLTGKKRLPGFEEAWKEYKQGQVVKFLNGRAYQRDEWETSGTPVCRLQNLTGSGEEFYYSNLSLPEKQYMHRGDLIYMWSASFGPYIWNGPKAIFHYHIWKLECDESLVARGFYYHKLVELTEQLKATTDGSTMLHLTKSGMEKFEVHLPLVAEQMAIAEVLSDMDAEIAAIEAKIDKARQIKAGMMQELLTGRTRLI